MEPQVSVPPLELELELELVLGLHAEAKACPLRLQFWPWPIVQMELPRTPYTVHTGLPTVLTGEQ